MHTLPRKFIKPSYFAPQKYEAMETLPHKIREQCRLCPAKSQGHSFRSQHNINNDLKKNLSFLRTVLVNHCYFINIYNTCYHFLRKTYFSATNSRFSTFQLGYSNIPVEQLCCVYLQTSKTYIVQIVTSTYNKYYNFYNHSQT